jgi:hypothetical protein
MHWAAPPIENDYSGNTKRALRLLTIPKMTDDLLTVK